MRADEGTYRHEASHVVADAVHRFEPTSVVVLGEGCGWAKVEIAGDGATSERMIGLLAGRVGARASGFHLDQRDGGDQREAFAVAVRLAMRRGARGDDDLDLAHHLVREAEAQASALVDEHGRAIAEVATRIRANGGRLAGDELREALEAGFRAECAWRPGDLDISPVLANRGWDRRALDGAALPGRRRFTDQAADRALGYPYRAVARGTLGVDHPQPSVALGSVGGLICDPRAHLPHKVEETGPRPGSDTASGPTPVGDRPTFPRGGVGGRPRCL